MTKLSAPSTIENLKYITEPVINKYVQLNPISKAEFIVQLKNRKLSYGYYPISKKLKICILCSDKSVYQCTFHDVSYLNVEKDSWKEYLQYDNEKTNRIVEDYISNKKINLSLIGTSFQIKVWEALLSIPSGCYTHYHNIAEWIHHPNAFRAAGNAIGRNPVGYLIPCHRVFGKKNLGGYYWGSDMKKQLLNIDFNKSF